MPEKRIRVYIGTSTRKYTYSYSPSIILFLFFFVIPATFSLFFRTISQLLLLADSKWKFSIIFPASRLSSKLSVSANSFSWLVGLLLNTYRTTRTYSCWSISFWCSISAYPFSQSVSQSNTFSIHQCPRYLLVCIPQYWKYIQSSLLRLQQSRLTIAIAR